MLDEISRLRLTRTLAGVLARMWRRTVYWRRQRLLCRRGARVTGNAFIAKGAQIGRADLVEIGEGAIVGRAHLYALARLVVGRHVIINDDVFICTASHDIDDPEYLLVVAPIRIGDYAWIATRSTILPGVTVGRGAIIGASAVVAKDVPDMAIVVGNPARVVGHRKTVHGDHVTRRLVSANPGDRFMEYQRAYGVDGSKGAEG